MTPTAARRRLPTIARRIESCESQLTALYAERLAAFKVLVDDGDTQQQIADLAKVGAPAVAFALHKDRKRSNANGTRRS